MAFEVFNWSPRPNPVGVQGPHVARAVRRRLRAGGRRHPYRHAVLAAAVGNEVYVRPILDFVRRHAGGKSCGRRRWARRAATRRARCWCSPWARTCTPSRSRSKSPWPLKRARRTGRARAIRDGWSLSKWASTQTYKNLSRARWSSCSSWTPAALAARSCGSTAICRSDRSSGRGQRYGLGHPGRGASSGGRGSSPRTLRVGNIGQDRQAGRWPA